MIRNLVLFFLVSSIVPASAQEFFGLLRHGGPESSGRMYSWTPGQGLTTVADFKVNQGGSGFTQGLIEASDGNLYGTTRFGGSCGLGTLFRYDPQNDTFEQLVNFDRNNGSNPVGRLFQASNGKIYGTTTRGGNNSFGILFSFEPGPDLFSIIHHFGQEGVILPSSGFIEPVIGKLYSHTTSGGTGSGAIYSFDLTTEIVSVELDFQNTDGRRPIGSLLDAGGGIIYGTTQETQLMVGSGKIFSFDAINNVYTTLADFFPNQIGFNPESDLILHNNWLYGFLEPRLGNQSFRIFGYDLINNQLSVRAEFTDLITGNNQWGGLILHNSQILGVVGSEFESEEIRSAVYRFHPDGDSISILSNLDSLGAFFPVGLPLVTGNQLLFSDARLGSGRSGRLLSFDLATNTTTTVFDLNEPAPLSFPISGLTRAPNGLLYGIVRDAANGGPAIYETDPATGVLNYVADIPEPIGERFTDPIGDHLYILATSQVDTLPAIYSFNFQTYQVTEAFQLPDSVDQNNWIWSALIAGQSNKLYGVISFGNPFGTPGLFEFDLSTQIFSVLDIAPEFTRGIYPWLTQLSTGEVIGAFGGQVANGLSGELFSYDETSDSLRILYSFNFNDVHEPTGAIVEGGPGVFYGIAEKGKPLGSSSNSSGAIYRYDLSTDSISYLYLFSSKNNGYLYRDGNLLYGVNAGIFSFSLLNSTYQQEAVFDCSTGVIPVSGLTATSFLQSTQEWSQARINLFPNPAESIIHIDLPDVRGVKVDLAVWGLEGRQYLRESWGSQTSGYLDISSLPAGTYVLTVRTNDRGAEKLFVKR